MMVKRTALFPGAKAGAKTKTKDRHRNRGMEFERALGEMHKIYRAFNLARIVKDVRSTVDYVGVLKSGKMVAVAAKACREDKIDLSRLQEHQRLYLDEVQALGGLAFVLVRFGCGAVARIPIRAWDYALAAKCAPETADTIEVDGWQPSGKAHIKLAEVPAAWKVKGCNWAMRCEDAEQQR